MVRQVLSVFITVLTASVPTSTATRKETGTQRIDVRTGACSGMLGRREIRTRAAASDSSRTIIGGAAGSPSCSRASRASMLASVSSARGAALTEEHHAHEELWSHHVTTPPLGLEPGSRVAHRRPPSPKCAPVPLPRPTGHLYER